MINKMLTEEEIQCMSLNEIEEEYKIYTKEYTELFNLSGSNGWKLILTAPILLVVKCLSFITAFKEYKMALQEKRKVWNSVVKKYDVNDANCDDYFKKLHYTYELIKKRRKKLKKEKQDEDNAEAKRKRDLELEYCKYVQLYLQICVEKVLSNATFTDPVASVRKKFATSDYITHHGTKMTPFKNLNSFLQNLDQFNKSMSILQIQGQNEELRKKAIILVLDNHEVKGSFREEMLKEVSKSDIPDENFNRLYEAGKAYTKKHYGLKYSKLDTFTYDELK